MHYTLSDLIADIVQNSVEADSSQITLELDETQTGRIKHYKHCLSK